MSSSPDGILAQTAWWLVLVTWPGTTIVFGQPSNQWGCLGPGHPLGHAVNHVLFLLTSAI